MQYLTKNPDGKVYSTDEMDEALQYVQDPEEMVEHLEAALAEARELAYMKDEDDGEVEELRARVEELEARVEELEEKNRKRKPEKPKGSQKALDYSYTLDMRYGQPPVTVTPNAQGFYAVAANYGAGGGHIGADEKVNDVVQKFLDSGHVRGVVAVCTKPGLENRIERRA